MSMSEAANHDEESLLAELAEQVPEMVRVAARILERAGAYSVLCPGCGRGRTGAFLARRGFRVTAYDETSQTISAASSAAVQAGVRIEAFVDDVVVPRRPLSRFDGLYAGDLLSHFLASQRRALLRGFQRALRQGGLVVVSVMSVEDERYGYGRPIEPDTFEYPNGDHIRFYSPHDLHAELGQFFAVMDIQDVLEIQEQTGVGRQRFRTLLATAQKIGHD